MSISGASRAARMGADERADQAMRVVFRLPIHGRDAYRLAPLAETALGRAREADPLAPEDGRSRDWRDHMTSQHTPGTWEIIEIDGPVIPSDGVHVVVVQREQNLIIAPVGLVGTPMTEANAHLIASAPAMLAALEAAVSDFDNWGEVWQSESAPDGGDVFTVLEQARAAIRAARGES